MLIIGFGHKARQGKNVCTQAIEDYYAAHNDLYLRYRHGGGIVHVQTIGFADALKELATKKYGMKEKDPILLQRLGEEKRAEDSDYWIKKAVERISSLTDVVLIPDTRYKNEAYAIRKYGGYVVNVIRMQPDGTRFIADDRPSNHASETELDGFPFDFTLVNHDGHEALLGEQAVTLAEYLRGLHHGT